MNLGLLGRHFLLFAGVEATREKWEVGGRGKAEAAGMARGKSRTSCRSIDDAKEEEGGRCERRDDGAHTERWARSIEEKIKE